MLPVKADEGSKMKSLEKLRKVAEEQSSPVACKLVRTYTGMDWMSADNSTIKEALGNALDEIEEELARYYVELPKDSDGVPIRPNDEIVVSHPDTEPQFSTVTALILRDRWFYEHVEHVQPDSWESIEEDARKWMRDNGTPRGVMNFISRCKALAGVK